MQFLMGFGLVLLAILGFTVFSTGFFSLLDNAQERYSNNKQFEQFVIENKSKFSTLEEARKVFEEQKRKENYEKFLEAHEQEKKTP